MDGQATSAIDWPGARIPAFLRDLSGIVVAVMSRDGILIDANTAFAALLPDQMTASDILDIRDLFVNPRFDQLATRRAGRADGAIYKGILNFGSLRDQVISLQGSVYALDDGILLAAEHEVAGLELMRSRILRLNDELAAEQRKLRAALKRIQRQRQAADAAVRELAAERDWFVSLAEELDRSPLPAGAD